MRLPNVARCLGLRPNLGLSDLLAGLCTLNDVVQPSGMLDNLRIIAAGSIPPNPMELLGSDQMGRLLDILRQFYDFIIFDLPPVNVVADGLVISRLVQGMIMVVRQDYGDRRAIADAVRRLQYLDVKILGFVMTYSQTGKKSYGYRKYGYGYGYGKRGRGHDYGYAYGRKASHNPRFTDSVLDKDAERRGASPDRDHKHAGGQTRAETK